MNFLTAKPLVDFTGGIVVTIVSIVVSFAIIIALILYVKNSKKKRNMVHNQKRKNDNPEMKK